jgi:hypothetical protein
MARFAGPLFGPGAGPRPDPSHPSRFRRQQPGVPGPGRLQWSWRTGTELGDRNGDAGVQNGDAVGIRGPDPAGVRRSAEPGRRPASPRVPSGASGAGPAGAAPAEGPRPSRDRPAFGRRSDETRDSTRRAGECPTRFGEPASRPPDGSPARPDRSGRRPRSVGPGPPSCRPAVRSPPGPDPISPPAAIGTGPHLRSPPPIATSKAPWPDHGAKTGLPQSDSPGRMACRLAPQRLAGRPSVPAIRVRGHSGLRPQHKASRERQRAGRPLAGASTAPSRSRLSQDTPCLFGGYEILCCAQDSRGES